MPLPEGALPWTIVADGVHVTVRATPRARRSDCAGMVDIGNDRQALGIRLPAPPVDGAANAELCAFVAKLLGVGRTAVRLRSGETGRIKTLHVAGDGKTLAAALSSIVGSQKGR